jgi:hypothetical protein
VGESPVRRGTAWSRKRKAKGRNQRRERDLFEGMDELYNISRQSSVVSFVQNP